VGRGGGGGLVWRKGRGLPKVGDTKIEHNPEGEEIDTPKSSVSLERGLLKRIERHQDEGAWQESITVIRKGPGGGGVSP